MPVIVTGTFILPDGEVAADRVITIRRANRGVVQQSGQVVLPDDVVIETDGTGQVLFDLMPGNYVGFARTVGGLSASFTMAVPDVETIDVAAVINAADIPEGAAVGPPGPVGPQGASAYQVAVSEGFVGTEAEWLESLIGPAGDDGEDGTNGTNGLSAYQVAVANGFVGTQPQWLASLVGLPGDDGTDGADGLSAYEVALANGFVGSESAWLASLVGADGEDGVDGGQGIQGPAGPTYNYRGESSALLNQSLAVLDTFTHTLSVSGRGTALLLKPKVARTLTSASIADLTAIFTNYDVMLLSQDGVAGANGTSTTITTVNTQAAFDNATPTGTQLIVRIA